MLSLAGPNIAKRAGRFKNRRGVTGRHILRLLIFGNARFWRLKAPQAHTSIRIPDIKGPI